MTRKELPWKTHMAEWVNRRIFRYQKPKKTQARLEKLNQEIRTLRSKIQTQDDAEQCLFPFTPGRDCCPSCRYGSKYTAWVEAQERREAWLAILLRKRDTLRKELCK